MSKIDNDTLITLVSKNLKISKNKLSLNSKQDDFLEWDSLANIRIFLDLSKLLNRDLSNEVIFKLDSIKSIIKIVEENN